jgi:hypothetical protein
VEPRSAALARTPADSEEAAVEAVTPAVAVVAFVAVVALVAVAAVRTGRNATELKLGFQLGSFGSGPVRWLRSAWPSGVVAAAVHVSPAPASLPKAKVAPVIKR